MKTRSLKRMGWTLAIIAGLAIAAAIGLRLAISANGPAVLSAVDRVIGGSGDAERVAVATTGEDDAQKLYVWAPEDAAERNEKRPVLLFVHGGSWRWGDPDDYGFVGRAFVPKGFVVVLAGYRLVPGGEYPAMLEDTAAAIAWTKGKIEQYGGDPDHIVIAGHSAGAYNVAAVALDQRWLGDRGLSGGDIAGVVGLSGPYDFYPFDSDSTRNAFGQTDDPEATQPVNHVRADAPPKLLIHGEMDTLVKPRNTRELAKRIEAVGGSVATRFYPEMDHNQPLISLAAPWRNSSDVAQRIADFALSVKPSVPVQAKTR